MTVDLILHISRSPGVTTSKIIVMRVRKPPLTDIHTRVTLHMTLEQAPYFIFWP